jgi:hypothetical protein
MPSMVTPFGNNQVLSVSSCPRALATPKRQELFGRAGVALFDGRRDSGDLTHGRHSGGRGMVSRGFPAHSGINAIRARLTR